MGFGFTFGVPPLRAPRVWLLLEYSRLEESSGASGCSQVPAAKRAPLSPLGHPDGGHPNGERPRGQVLLSPWAQAGHSLGVPPSHGYGAEGPVSYEAPYCRGRSRPFPSPSHWGLGLNWGWGPCFCPPISPPYILFWGHAAASPPPHLPSILFPGHSYYNYNYFGFEGAPPSHLNNNHDTRARPLLSPRVSCK